MDNPNVRAYLRFRLHVRRSRGAGADAGEDADAPGLGQRHPQPPVRREPHLARQILQRPVPPVLPPLRRRRRRVERGPHLLLQPPPPLLRVVEVHGGAGGGDEPVVLRAAGAAGVGRPAAPPVLDGLVEERDEAFHVVNCDATRAVRGWWGIGCVLSGRMAGWALLYQPLPFSCKCLLKIEMVNE